MQNVTKKTAIDYVMYDAIQKIGDGTQVRIFCSVKRAIHNPKKGFKLNIISTDLLMKYIIQK